MKYFVLLTSLLVNFSILAQSKNEINKWNLSSKKVEIIRDEFGVPHIYGKTDADAVFGLLYAQCEDDFYRVELNYIEKLGRLAEINGKKDIGNDIYTRLIIDQEDAKKDYQKSPLWLKKLLNAFADGINYYLYKHPAIQPRLIKHFEPWFPLLWTDGSIGAISTGDITANETFQLFGMTDVKMSQNQIQTEDEYLTGSNGFAISPLKSKTGNALFYINPHVTFYFRPEVHMVSEQGLNVYGAVTWGQFFIYQGFNQFNGWMHTSSQVDVSDMYREKIRDESYYLLDNQWKPLVKKYYQFKVKGDTNLVNITAKFTGHGPIMAKRNGEYIAVKSYNRSMKSLMQSWLRTKTKGFEDFRRNMQLRSNTSNNTVFADYKGNIAYWHGNFVPKRNPNLDWGIEQDGSLSKNDWKGLHPLEEIVHVYNPKSGWIQNCNSSPFNVAGKSSPLKSNFPVYMAPDGENFRDLNAARLLDSRDKLNLDDLIELGYDRKLTAFEYFIPALIQAFDRNQNQYSSFKNQMDTLRNWNYYVDKNSIAQTLAISWAKLIQSKIPKIKMFGGEIDQVNDVKTYLKNVKDEELLEAFSKAVLGLKEDFGTWQISWGELNRFQRIDNSIISNFDDQQASIAVPFASSSFGMLPSYTSRPMANTKKWYGVNGNSFVCAVEFGSKIKAKSLLAGGQSGDKTSPHFFDQANMYANGTFKDVHFYREDVIKHQMRAYHP
ncbi:penicillin acylase family protein [Aquirufa sp. ROCK-SH2]